MGDVMGGEDEEGEQVESATTESSLFTVIVLNSRLTGNTRRPPLDSKLQ
jgi:hypothetical protein